MLMHILLTTAVAYAVFCGFIYLVQQRIVYLEWVISFKPPVVELAGAQELRLGCGDASIRIWTLHQELKPALLYLGGSSEDVRINLSTFDSLFADPNVAADCLPFLPARWLLKDDYDSMPWVPQIRDPVLVVLAEKDELVRKARSDALISAIPAACRHVRTIQGAAHTNLRRFAAYAQSLKDFVVDHTLQDSAPARAWETDTPLLDVDSADDAGPALDTGAAS
jgi:hypothetical protein